MICCGCFLRKVAHSRARLKLPPKSKRQSKPAAAIVAGRHMLIVRQIFSLVDRLHSSYPSTKGVPNQTLPTSVSAIALRNLPGLGDKTVFEKKFPRSGFRCSNRLPGALNGGYPLLRLRDVICLGITATGRVRPTADKVHV